MKATKHAHEKLDLPNYTVSGFFDNKEKVQAVMQACLHQGIPRDLMDVAVSQGAAARFFGGKAGASHDSWFSWAGRGALTGLLLTAITSLSIVLLPGFKSSNLMAMVQLLGPDIGIILGAAVGGLYGWMRESDIRPVLQRAAERTDAMLLLIHPQSQTEADTVRGIFEQCKGENIRLDTGTANSVGVE